MQETKIASWSGPRNISTAMMRSWENRTDTAVCDEPLYAHYLQDHGFDHPGREEILQHCDTDAARVTSWLTGSNPDGSAVFYQKHMAHHLVETVPRDWIRSVRNVFLIRDPQAMLLSLDKVVPNPEPKDTGLPQQLELFRSLKAEGHICPVIDSRDLLKAPEEQLRTLCTALDLAFDNGMLNWPAGRRDSDGIWAPHWYDAVEQSTGFAPYTESARESPSHLQAVLEQVQPAFDELYEARLTSARTELNP